MKINDSEKLSYISRNRINNNKLITAKWFYISDLYYTYPKLISKIFIGAFWYEVLFIMIIPFYF